MASLNHSLSPAEFGLLVGITRRSASRLVERGVIEKDMTGADALIAYCSHLREQAAGRAASGDLDLAAERAGLAKAQRERIEMQNAVTRRELAQVVLIEEVLAKAGSRVAGILDAIPGMIKRRVHSLTSGDIDLIAGEVARARNVAAAISLDDLRDEEQQEATDDEAPD